MMRKRCQHKHFVLKYLFFLSTKSELCGLLNSVKPNFLFELHMWRYARNINHCFYCNMWHKCLSNVKWRLRYNSAQTFGNIPIESWALEIPSKMGNPGHTLKDWPNVYFGKNSYDFVMVCAYYDVFSNASFFSSFYKDRQSQAEIKFLFFEKCQKVTRVTYHIPCIFLL